MTFIPRQSVRPGLGGYSPRPIDPSEARSIQNMLLKRDGVWVPRPGLETVATFSGTVTHVGIRPSNSDNKPIVVIEGGRLRVVGEDGSSTQKDTGWPDRVKTTIGGGTSGTALYWLAHKSAPNGNGGSLYKIELDGTFAAISAAPSGTWVENYGLYTMSVGGGDSMRFSDAADSDTWPALNEVNGPRECGSLVGLISIDENRLLIIGGNGSGVLTGASEDVFSVGQLYNIGFVCRGNTVIKAGNRAVFMGPGSKLYLFNPDLERFDGPVEDDLDDVGDSDLVSAFYDPVLNCYCIAHSGIAKTLLFDLEKKRWIGSYDKALIGMGVYPGIDSHPRVRRFVGYSDKLLQFDEDGNTWTDAGSAYTCQIDVGPEFQQMPEGLKQMRQLYLDAAGTWTVTLLGRNSPEASYTTIQTKTGITGPAWVSFARHTYRERVIRLSATAASGVALRGLKLDERIVRTARS